MPAQPCRSLVGEDGRDGKVNSGEQEREKEREKKGGKEDSRGHVYDLQWPIFKFFFSFFSQGGKNPVLPLICLGEKPKIPSFKNGFLQTICYYPCFGSLDPFTNLSPSLPIGLKAHQQLHWLTDICIFALEWWYVKNEGWRVGFKGHLHPLSLILFVQQPFELPWQPIKFLHHLEVILLTLDITCFKYYGYYCFINGIECDNIYIVLVLLSIHLMLIYCHLNPTIGIKSQFYKF